MPLMRANGTIGECIANGYTITAWCPNGHSTQLDLVALCDKLGPDHSALRDALLPRLRCSQCRAKANALICAPVTGPQGWPGG